MNLDETTKQTIDVISVGTVLATLSQWLPSIAAIISIIWGAIRIWETKTVQGWISKRKCAACEKAGQKEK